MSPNNHKKNFKDLCDFSFYFLAFPSVLKAIRAFSLVQINLFTGRSMAGRTSFYGDTSLGAATHLSVIKGEQEVVGNVRFVR